ncbi:DUF2784 domain-containing protein [Massilia sp. GCM10023247]|uniref:DUF2784 domain-containing protein n=1 Tax=Massilia sp. GCM10023247 TaxID=3252643 RepID=UPI00361919BD
MSLAIASSLVLLAHLAFVLFVVFGAALVARWPRLALLHLPAVAWGVFVELTGRACPLTALENGLRLRAGLEGYAESFIEHYLLALLYPGGLTREVQLALAAAVALVNLLLYGWVLVRSRRRRAGLRPASLA